MLAIRDPGWHMTFTSDPFRALELIRTGGIDVIVTDMRMPLMSGVELLKEAHASHPQTVRIVLSGFAEEQAVLASLVMTHRFLSKPIGADELIGVVDRACALQDMLDSEELCKVAGRVGSLPSRPTIYTALTQELSSPVTSLADIAKLVEQDIAITAKLLQVVNSAFIGVPQKTISVARAVSFIGAALLKNLVLSLEVFQAMGKARRLINLDDEYRHALLTATLASRLCEQRELVEDAFVAGLLHDIGKLVMATQMTAEFADVSSEARALEEPRHEVEYRRYQVCHAEVGAYLLGAWGMPYHVVDAVAAHHRPRSSQNGTLDVAGAVYLANRLAGEMRGDPIDRPFEIDATWLESMGGEPRLAEWRDMAAKMEPDGC